MALTGYNKDFSVWDEWVFKRFEKEIYSLGPRNERTVEVFKAVDGSWKAIHTDGSRPRVVDLATGIEEFGEDIYASKGNYAGVSAWVPTFYLTDYLAHGSQYFSVREVSQASSPSELREDRVFSLPVMFNGWTRTTDHDYIRLDLLLLSSRGEVLEDLMPSASIELPADIQSVRDFVRFEVTKEYGTRKCGFSFKVLSESFYAPSLSGLKFSAEPGPSSVILTHLKE